jgi:galactonate dehydratase
MALLTSIEAIPFRQRRDQNEVVGTAGSPTALEESAFDYRWSATYATLYSVCFETALVKITNDDGLVGWGEAQAPLAPEVACTIVDRLLRPAIEGRAFSGEPAEIEHLWDRMYSTMRVRGQTGGFMLDAISGVDLALWDLAGKMAGQPVWKMLDAASAPDLPAYGSGLAGETTQAKVEHAGQLWQEGFRTYKLFHDRDESDLLELIDRLRKEFGSDIRIAVDALWHLRSEGAIEFGRELDRRDILWLEAPLLPEDVDAHRRLAEAITTPIALGESYRTRWEIEPFLRDPILSWFQPDLGRCGMTEGLRMARLAADAGARVVPHVSIAMGPQIAAALHFATVAPRCELVEYNPKVFRVANRFAEQPLALKNARYKVPQTPGLGVDPRPPGPTNDP